MKKFILELTAGEAIILSGAIKDLEDKYQDRHNMNCGFGHLLAKVRTLREQIELSEHADRLRWTRNSAARKAQ